VRTLPDPLCRPGPKARGSIESAAQLLVGQLSGVGSVANHELAVVVEHVSVRPVVRRRDSQNKAIPRFASNHVELHTWYARFNSGIENLTKPSQRHVGRLGFNRPQFLRAPIFLIDPVHKIAAVRIGERANILQEFVPVVVSVPGEFPLEINGRALGATGVAEALERLAINLRNI
jgi:hypothetical protein